MSIRVLLADDQTLVRSGFRVLLERAGDIDVVGEAADGEQTLVVVDKEHPDLLVLDLAMPHMDGLEVLTVLQARTEPPPPVVVLSGFTNEAMVRKAMSLGAAAYIPKGRDLTDLPDLFAAAVATNAALRAYVGACARVTDAVERLGADGLERTTSSGWTAKELLAHLAFWEETHVPVVIEMFRGERLPAGWQFGSGDLGLAEGEPWPPADVHNAREAAWARSQPASVVVGRWRRAVAQALELFRNYTPAETNDARFVERISVVHLEEHLPELLGLLDLE